MENSKIEEAYNDTFSGLTMYYRDCELKQELISKYKTDQILMERGFTDVSSFAEGLGKKLRYAIASNKAVNMGQINPEVAKFGFNLISAPAHYKVLDIYTVGSQTQILLLHFDEKFIDIFKSTKSNVEEKVVGMGRESLDKKIQMKPNEDLNGKEWTERTQFPIGMSDGGDFFLPISGTITKAKKSENKTQIKKENSTENDTQIKPSKEKKGFWKRLFG